MTARLLYLNVCMLVTLQAVAQQSYGPNDTIVVYATYHLPDSTLIPTSALENVYCYGKYPAAMREKMKAWSRLRNAVYVTYPYAKEAGRTINEINASLKGVESKAVRRTLIKSREKELKKNFADKLMNLSVYQGKVLMKLINRETGNNCFELIKEYKGGVNAQVWQTVAFLFGSNLKQPYDPHDADAEIEKFVKEVELLYRG
ncbi:MAG: DUF4294 domain-containing protein [Bacteroidetes bacterium]|nr:MAG: DUF4294 domain-containing protein [Bacteroidota bacterium]